MLINEYLERNAGMVVLVNAIGGKCYRYVRAAALLEIRAGGSCGLYVGRYDKLLNASA